MGEPPTDFYKIRELDIKYKVVLELEEGGGGVAVTSQLVILVTSRDFTRISQTAQ